MKKRLISVILCAVLAAALCVPVFALELFDEHPARVVDDADLLTSFEEQQLTAKLDEISERQQFDVVVVTADFLGGKSPMEYADDYYDYNGYGFGTDGDGMLLLISMEDRDWWISTKGQGIEAFSDSDIDYVGSCILSELSGGDYYGAFCTYAELADQAVESAKNGYSGGFSGYDDYGDDDYYYDGDYYGDYGSRSSDGTSVFKRAAAALIGGFIIALIVTGSMKNKLTSVRFKSGAADYTKKGSMNVTLATENFLYSTVTKTKKPEPESRSGGGSHSSHTSSSGSSHGGGGGKF